VDDLTLRIRGENEDRVEADFVETFGAVLHDLGGLKLTYSQEKTIVRGSSRPLAERAAVRLARKGVPVRANLAVTDLGVPVAWGKRRVATQANKRISANKGRSSRAKWMTRINPKGLILAKTGLIPAITWGGIAFGTPPQHRPQADAIGLRRLCCAWRQGMPPIHRGRTLRGQIRSLG